MDVCGHCFRTTAVDAVVCFVVVFEDVHIPSPLIHHLTRALDGWTSAGTGSEPQQWMLSCVLYQCFGTFIFQVCSHTTSREHLMDGRLWALLQNHSSGCCCGFNCRFLRRSYPKSAPTPPHERAHDDALVAHAVCGSGAGGILSCTCTAAVVTAFHAAAESASHLVIAVGPANGQVCARVLTSTPPVSPYPNPNLYPKP